MQIDLKNATVEELNGFIALLQEEKKQRQLDHERARRDMWRELVGVKVYLQGSISRSILCTWAVDADKYDAYIEGLDKGSATMEFEDLQMLLNKKVGGK